MSVHTCPAGTCEAQISSDRLACGRHWYMLPLDIRNEIWLAWRGRASNLTRHARAVRRALDWYRENT